MFCHNLSPRSLIAPQQPLRAAPFDGLAGTFDGVADPQGRDCKTGIVIFDNGAGTHQQLQPAIVGGFNDFSRYAAFAQPARLCLPASPLLIDGLRPSDDIGFYEALFC